MSAMRWRAMQQLLLFRLRAVIREPSALFWTFVFPILTSIALGIAFQEPGTGPIKVALAHGPGELELAQRLAAPPLRVERSEAEQAYKDLESGLVSAVVVPGEHYAQLVLNPTQSDTPLVRCLTRGALEKGTAAPAAFQIQERLQASNGARYIDFLIPGLIGFGLLSFSLWGMGFSIVQMRTGKLLRRLLASPVRRSDVLLSFVVSRLALAPVEVGVLALFGHFLFKVPVRGSWVTLLAFALLGAFCFAGLSLLTFSRAQNAETAGGLGNLVQMPMLILSGVFFSSSHFPRWLKPVIDLLPLTVVNDGLRAIMTTGAGFTALLPSILLLGAWSVGSFGLALYWFRWE